MLILPIVNNNHVMNVEIRLKGAYKIRQRVDYEDARSGDIIVNREKFSESTFSGSKDKNATIDFIRSKSILYPRSFLVTTKRETDSSYYDVYKVPQPPKKVNAALDELYSKTILDMKNEIPGKPTRGRYVSFEDIGLDKGLSGEKIAALQRIMTEDRNSSSLGEKLEKAGVADLPETARFFDNFECTILSDTTIPEESIQDSLKALSPINTRDYRNLKKYYHMAQSNADIYTKISYISKIVYDRPLALSRSTTAKHKQYVKRMEDGSNAKAA